MKNIFLLILFFVGMVCDAQTFIKENNLFVYPLGSVGIGTLTPLSILDVAGTGTLLSAMIVPRDTSANRPSSPVNGMIRYNTNTAGFEGYSNSAWRALGGAGGATYVNSGTGLLGGPITSTGTLSADPSVVFEQNGNAFGNTGILGTTDANPLALLSGGIASIQLDQFGNVNIGPFGTIFVANQTVSIGTGVLATNGNQLEVQGNVQFDNSLELNGFLTFGPGPGNWIISNQGSTPGSYMLIVGGADQNGNLRLQSNSGCISNCTDYIGFLTGNAGEQARITSNGNIGIGTTTPRAILEVTATGTFSSIIVPRGTTANRSAAAVNGMIRYNINTSAFEAYVNGNWDTVDTSVGATGAYLNGGNSFGVAATLGTKDANRFAILTNGTARLYIDQLGNVGIGSTSTININVAGRVGIGTLTPIIGAIADFSTTGTSFSSIIIPRDTTANRPTGGVNGMMRYNTNLSQFEVYENSNWAGITVAAESAFVNGGNSFGALATIGTKDLNSFNLQSNGAGRIYIDQIGNVSIGSTSAIVVSQSGFVTINPTAGVTISPTGALSLGSGASAFIAPATTLTLKSGTSTTIGSLGFVTLNPTGGVTIAPGGSLSMSSGTPGMNMSSAGFITLQATGGVTISPTGTLSLGSAANGFLAPATTLVIGSGTSTTIGSTGFVLLNPTAGVTIAPGGNLSMSSGTPGMNMSSAGFITMQATGGITISPTGTLSLGSAAGAFLSPATTLSINSGTSTTIGSVGFVTINPTAGVTISPGGSLSLNSGTPGIFMTSTGFITMQPTGGITINPTGDLSLGSGANMIIAPAGALTMSSSRGTIMSGAGFITLQPAGGVTISPTGNLSLGSGGSIIVSGHTFTTINGSGFMTLNPAAGMTLSPGGTFSLGGGANGFINMVGALTMSAGRVVLIDPVPAGNGNNVGIGTPTPVQGTIADFEGTGTSFSSIKIPQDSTGNRPFPVGGMMRFNTTTSLFEVYESTAWSTFTVISDARAKKDIEPIQNGLEMAEKMKPVYFDWNAENKYGASFANGRRQVGFIAQDMEKILPEVVDKATDGLRSLRYGQITPVAIAAIQELDKRTRITDLLCKANSEDIQWLKEKILSLMNVIDAQDKRLKMLEKDHGR